MRPKTYSILRYLLALACTALVCAFAAAPGARAADSLAPPGAPRDWLPPTTEQWVYEHWLPYDQNTLFRILGVNLEGVRNYFDGTNFQRVPTLAALARSRGLSVQRLARELVDSWHPRVSRGLYALLLNHATRSLTQGHLMQHMLFHPFHDTALHRASPRIFGVSPSQLDKDLAQGMTYREIGHAHGRTDREMIARSTAVLRGEEAVGVKQQFTPASEAREELSIQLSLLPVWLGLSGANPQKIIFGNARQLSS